MSTTEYSSWYSMKHRCYNKSDKYYPRYGGRGITVCDRWLESFDNFLSDMGKKPTDEYYSLDRIDNDGNYEPANCRWATRLQQNTNRSRFKTRYITFNGKNQTLADWSRETGLSSQTILMRLSYGWSIEKALTQGVRQEIVDLADCKNIGHAYEITMRLSGLTKTEISRQSGIARETLSLMCSGTRNVPVDRQVRFYEVCQNGFALQWQLAQFGKAIRDRELTIEEKAELYDLEHRQTA